jgi:hypothetical protein
MVWRKAAQWRLIGWLKGENNISESWRKKSS